MLSIYRILALVAVALVVLSGCDYSPFHQKWACESGQEDLKLRCEMSKSVPIFRSAEHLHGIDFCEPKMVDYEINIRLSLSFIESEGHYVAVGGYCDFHSRYDGILNHLEAEDMTFDGMLFQVHSCEPDRYEDLNRRAEALGLNVTSHQISNCEAE